MTNYIGNQHPQAIEHAESTEPLDIPMAPPAPPRLKARAAPLEFQGFSMSQVEQAISSYGRGSHSGMTACPRSASNCSFSSYGGCISQNGSSSQRFSNPSDLMSQGGYPSMLSHRSGIDTRPSSSFVPSGDLKAAQKQSLGSQSCFKPQPQIESLMECCASIDQLNSMSMP